MSAQAVKPRKAKKRRGMRLSSPVTPSPPSPEQKSGLRFWQWSLLWISVTLILAGSGVMSIWWLLTPPPPPSCQNLSRLGMDSQRLQCAQEVGQSGDPDALISAMALVADWPLTHPLHSEAQRFLREWSQMVLKMAKEKTNRGQFDQAADIANQIPVSSPLYPEAQAAIATWQEEWQQGQAILREFEAAIQGKRWKEAAQMFSVIAELESDYWRSENTDQMLSQLSAETKAWQQLEDAKKIAQDKTPEALGNAIALANQIPATSLVKLAAREQQMQWSEQLMAVAVQHLENQDLAAAMAIASQVSLNNQLEGEARSLMLLSQATVAAKKDTILGLTDALTAVRQIDSDSLLFAIAQERATQWQAKLNDKMQLKVAQNTANLDSKMGIEMAIQQAKKINSDRPSASEAQQLIRQWQSQLKQIQQRDAQSRLDVARSFANKGDLVSAIQATQEIIATHPSYSPAQKARDEWTKKLQTQQDDLILNTAKQLAQKGNLQAAILTASQITQNRPLYEQAQAAIAQWKSNQSI